MTDQKKNKVRLEVTARLSPEMHEALRQRAFDGRVSQQHLMVAALGQFLTGAPPAASSTQAKPGKFDNYYRMLGEIFDSGDREAISAVTQNILVFHRIVGAAAAAAGEGAKKKGR